MRPDIRRGKSPLATLITFNSGLGWGRIHIVDATSATAPPRSAPKPGRSLHRFANPGRFLRLSGAVLPWLAVPGLLLTVIGIAMYWAVTTMEAQILHYLPRAVDLSRDLARS